MMVGNIGSFGEILLRYAPDIQGDWLKNQSMSSYIGGAELNVASALAKWGLPVKYITAVPENYLGHALVDFVAEKNIQQSDIVFSGSRVGAYYLPVGLELKHAGVIYDRAHSAFSELQPGQLDWEKIMGDCSWFHFSALSPALNENVAAVCKDALEVASRKGLTISVDLNYRSKLWQYTSNPAPIMDGLVKYCDVVMGNVWAVESLLGIPSSVKTSEGKTKAELTDAAAESMLRLHQRYPKSKIFAYTYRLEQQYWALLQKENQLVSSGQYALESLVDKVGSGDCFMAGLIYGLYHQLDPQHIIDYATAAAVGKLQEAGDNTNQTVEMIEQRMILLK